ncbi:thioredoxin [Blastochloris tepida]|jgi:putative thioredoxin|uniref:Thioredoxin n=1 Tax=Blastochloris tepida TaxID=2233851 RepID=A0A348G2K0_9HYPH|nr:thioredoxin [Blastochloris tepida]BBF93783.1 thioredoxin [Blastochloris tepida]
MFTFGGTKKTGTATGADDGLVRDVTTQSFVKDVIEESKTQPVLVDFWAAWCGPCKQLTPVLEKVVRAAKGKVKLAKMNIDEHPAVAGQMGIQSIPTVIAFVDGRPLDGFMGAQSEAQVVAFIERITKGSIGGGTKELLEAADAALVGGDPVAAAEAFAAVLGEEPENPHALAGLARCHLELGDIDKAKQTLALVPQAKANDPAVAAARAAIEIAEQAASLGDLAGLEGALAANPADHQARFDLALALNARGRRAEALNHLLEIVRRDRAWNEDGARKQLVTFFEAWGPADPHTIEGRRRLSSILFA